MGRKRHGLRAFLLTGLYVMIWMFVLWAVIFIISLIVRAQDDGDDPLCMAAELDNDINDTWEVFCLTPSLRDGEVRARDTDKDGDFDELDVGIGGSSTLFGWSNMDGDSREFELVLASPNLPPRFILKADADGDGDAEVVWVGVMGNDLDGDGRILPFEVGRIFGFADFDGDGNDEIVVADSTRKLGQFHLASFGIRYGDRMEIVWVGLVSESGRSYAASIVHSTDLDKDGDDDLILLDIRRESSEREVTGETMDADRDGDMDLFISREVYNALQ